MTAGHAAGLSNAGEQPRGSTWSAPALLLFSIFFMATTATAQRPASQDAPSPAPAEKPLKLFRSGNVSAAIYAKKRTVNGKSVTFPDVSLRRSFKTEGGWGHTHVLGGRDLLDAVFVLTQAAAYIAEADLDKTDE